MIAQACGVPRDGLLQAYVGQGATYTDCFEVMSPRAVSLPELIEAFYTTWLFRLERSVLSMFLRRRVRDSDVHALAQGGDNFAVWQVEARGETQILLKERTGHTRSFLAVLGEEGGGTRLIFGSAVVAQEGKPLGPLIRALTPLHQLYSKCLIRLAERKLRFT